MRCPFCKGTITWRHLLGRGVFLCPGCGFTSRIPTSDGLIAAATGAVVGGLLGYALGARDNALIGAVLLGVFPGALLVAFISAHVFGPTLVPAGGFVDEGVAHAFGEMRASAAPAPGIASRVGRLSLVFLAILAFVGLLSGLIAVCRWSESVYNSIPAFAVHTGPAAFPVTVRIREDGLDFTNGSTGPWTCRAEVGFRVNGTDITGIGASPAFPLAAAATRTVVYSAFKDGNLPLTHDVAYRAARRRISVYCTDEARHTHSIWF